MANVEVKWSSGAFEEIAKSPQVYQKVEQVTKKLASDANKRAESHKQDLRIEGKNNGRFPVKEFKVKPYAPHVKLLTHTSFGAVDIASTLGAQDQNKHHTLNTVVH